MPTFTKTVLLVLPGAFLASALIAPAALAAPTPAAPTETLVYLPNGTDRVQVGGSDGVATTSLTPAGIVAQTPAASADGGVVAYGSYLDSASAGRTWGLRVSVPGKTTIVTDSWDTAPFVEASGQGVWWLSSRSLWRYDVALGTTTEECANCIPSPSSSPVPMQLTISPNDHHYAAVEFAAYGSNSVQAAGTIELLDIRPDAAERVLYTKSSTLTFATTSRFSADAAILVITRTVPWAQGHSRLLTLDPAALQAGEQNTHLDGYGAQQLTVGGSWTYFQDDTTSDQLKTFTSPDLITATQLTGTLAPNPRAYGYAVVSASPAAFATPEPLPAVAALFGPRSTTKAVTLWAERRCPLAACDDQYVTVIGALQASYDGTTWQTLINTTAATHPYRTTIARTTYFRWTAPMSGNLAAATSPVLKTVYQPVFGTLKMLTIKGRRYLTGTVSRSTGTVVIRVLVNGKWLASRTAREISPRGAFALTYHFVKAGRYSVYIGADAYGAAATSASYYG